MVQQNRDLPEGTDSIIPGAMDTDTSDVTGAAPQGGGGSRSTAGRQRTGARSSSGGSAGTSSGESGGGGGLMDKVRSQGSRLTDEAAGKARGFVGEGLERSSEALSNASRMISDTASGIDERLGKDYGDYARRAAEALDNTASRIANKDPDELIDDTREFVRKSPGVALAGAAIVGFALARLVKSGISSVSGDEGAEAPRSGTGTSTGTATRSRGTGDTSGRTRS